MADIESSDCGVNPKFVVDGQGVACQRTKNEGSTVYYVLEVFTKKGHLWEVDHRYSDFDELADDLAQDLKLGHRAELPGKLPRKSIFTNKQVIEKRRTKLAKFCTKLIEDQLCRESNVFQNFLTVGARLIRDGNGDYQNPLTMKYTSRQEFMDSGAASTAPPTPPSTVRPPPIRGNDSKKGPPPRKNPGRTGPPGRVGPPPGRGGKAPTRPPVPTKSTSSRAPPPPGGKKSGPPPNPSQTNAPPPNPIQSQAGANDSPPFPPNIHASAGVTVTKMEGKKIFPGNFDPKNLRAGLRKSKKFKLGGNSDISQVRKEKEEAGMTEFEKMMARRKNKVDTDSAQAQETKQTSSSRPKKFALGAKKSNPPVPPVVNNGNHPAPPVPPQKTNNAPPPPKKKTRMVAFDNTASQGDTVQRSNLTFNKPAKKANKWPPVKTGNSTSGPAKTGNSGPPPPKQKTKAPPSRMISNDNSSQGDVQQSNIKFNKAPPARKGNKWPPVKTGSSSSLPPKPPQKKAPPVPQKKAPPSRMISNDNSSQGNMQRSNISFNNAPPKKTTGRAPPPMRSGPPSGPSRMTANDNTQNQTSNRPPARNKAPPVPGKKAPPVPGKKAPPVPGKKAPPVPGKKSSPPPTPGMKKTSSRSGPPPRSSARKAPPVRSQGGPPPPTQTSRAPPIPAMKKAGSGRAPPPRKVPARNPPVRSNSPPARNAPPIPVKTANSPPMNAPPRRSGPPLRNSPPTQPPTTKKSSSRRPPPPRKGPTRPPPR